MIIKLQIFSNSVQKSTSPHAYCLKIAYYHKKVLETTYRKYHKQILETNHWKCKNLGKCNVRRDQEGNLAGILNIFEVFDVKIRIFHEILCKFESHIDFSKKNWIFGLVVNRDDWEAQDRGSSPRWGQHFLWVCFWVFVRYLMNSICFKYILARIS